MKKILIIKTSSLGDVIHTLPALTDAGRAIPGIRFDWVVEEGFREIPVWHPLVDKVIPVAIRRWRKNIFNFFFSKEVKNFWRALRQEKYDLIIDAQGLMKSACLTRFARGVRVGLDKNSLTEKLARFAYQQNVTVDLSKHAMFRMRSIFSQALGYPLPKTIADSGLSHARFPYDAWDNDKYILFLHGTTWATKRWPNQHWSLLAKKLGEAGYRVRMPWSNQKERELVEVLHQESDYIDVLPGMDLSHLAGIIEHAKAVVAVDTGLGHLAAALNKPTVSLYGPTDPARVGTEGQNQIHLVSTLSCAGCDKNNCKKSKKEFSACMESITPDEVFERLKNGWV